MWVSERWRSCDGVGVCVFVLEWRTEKKKKKEER